jgi:hypothetical protein
MFKKGVFLTILWQGGDFDNRPQGIVMERKEGILHICDCNVRKEHVEKLQA